MEVPYLNQYKFLKYPYLRQLPPRKVEHLLAQQLQDDLQRQFRCVTGAAGRRLHVLMEQGGWATAGCPGQ